MGGQPRVVVGYDGSDFSVQALLWAVDECELRGLPLTIAHAWRWPYGAAPPEAKAHLRKAAEHVLHHGADCARSTGSVTDVATDLCEGSAAERLVELSAGAGLVVVGSRGLGAPARSVVGSVAASVAAGARAPVVVVRGPGPVPAQTHRGPLVLGLAPATPDEAVEFAFTEAALRSLPVIALHLIHVKGMAWGVEIDPLPDADALRTAARARMDERLAARRAGHPDVRLELRALIAPAREALRVASEGAGLLVVGADRTRPGGALGTVARAMTETALCPVAVVPEGGAGPADAR
ncbi:universal stress protein [Nonomuraea rhodomycinica]|uniref:Universal stress protein n=1 Tax=Nonomuraea rhodomycinica TaxID=1712872 RepID=A0A7Y6IJQ2_9ACTN|nr:universal stress protein [Nonomuraea rhodomycinica]NUW39417.1 universal stress protein [Nonomuraea rhodomycinica]